MLDKSKVVILIPAYEPDIKFVDLIVQLIKLKFSNILVINDGSTLKSEVFFNDVKKYENVRIVSHAVNQGKGRALKTGFNTIINDYPDVFGCITVDADGQHLPVDIEKLSKKLINNPDKLILGVRDFDEGKVPARSKFGNKLTRNVLNILGGIKITDTQTGLRALSVENMSLFMKTNGESYEYEMHMILDSKEFNIDILEVPITTVYIEENASSHFNPILDSAKIYKVFMKYIISSFASSVIDIASFYFFINVFSTLIPNLYILVSTAIARIISVTFNYQINAKKVFKSDNQRSGSFQRYVFLAIIQLLISAIFVSIISQNFHINETLTKIIVDTMLFFISFIIQREFIFAKENN